ncbi:Ig heavy chain V region G4, partial [Charadrius vociferus]
EAGGGLRAPGDSVLLSCRGSGSDLEVHGVLWYHQAPGGRLERVSYISGPSSTVKEYGALVDSRAIVSQDNSQSESSLSLAPLHPRDCAHYFCAVRTG